MADIGKAIKDEMARIAQREARKITAAPSRKAAELRRLVADLRRRVTRLEKAAKATPASQTSVADPAQEQSGKRIWFTGAGVTSLRKRLGLTQNEMGRLCGVSQKNVSTWEKRKGKLNLRSATKEKLMSVRGINKTQARAVLNES